jgi:hypothetical protein
MNPRTAIPPHKIIRRSNAKRWHLLDFNGDDGYRTYCSQNIRWPRQSTAYDATQITCTDCLRAAIGRKADSPKLCSEGNCGLPATKGGLCAGHNRLYEYHPFAATNE